MSMNWDIIEQISGEEFFKYHVELDNRLEYALRRLIPCPIKGEITLGKIRYRGVYLAYEQFASLDKFPFLCLKDSRSGKRKAFKVDLNFNNELLAAYEFEMSIERAITFGHRKNDKKNNCSGIITQIINNQHSSGESMTEFMQLVREMRKAQKEYFKTRDKDVLAKSKQLEKRVDDEIKKEEAVAENQEQLDKIAQFNSRQQKLFDL